MRGNNEGLIGLLAGFAASYECYTDEESKPIAQLVGDRECDEQHRAWMLHSLMALTETAWAS